MHLEIERQLAYLLGWFNIVEVEGKLIGYPPGANMRKEFRSCVPQYTRDMQTSEDLRKEFNVHITLSNDGKVYYGDMYCAKIPEYTSDDEARMCLVALEVMEILDGVPVTYP